MMDVQEQGVGNLMTVTVETVYAPPESWTMAGTQYAYATALPVPVAADVSQQNKDLLSMTKLSIEENIIFVSIHQIGTNKNLRIHIIMFY